MGQYEVKHTGGIGWFFFALIPGALAGAAMMYFSFYAGVIDWQKAQRIEGRMDNRVGVNGKLTAPIELIMRNSGCLKVSRSYLDGKSEDDNRYNPGSDLTVYVTNQCHDAATPYEWEIFSNSVAPDGTIISSNRDIQTGQLEPGQTQEIVEKVPNDSRTVKVVTWVHKDN